MSSSIGAIYDDYEDYESLCEKLGIESLPIRGERSFYKHLYDILKENEVTQIRELFQKLEKENV